MLVTASKTQGKMRAESPRAAVVVQIHNLTPDNTLVEVIRRKVNNLPVYRPES